MASKEQILTAYQITFIIGDEIRELKEVPSGHLYAMVMGKLSLEVYNGAIGALKRAGVVEERGNVLYWIEPSKEQSS